MFMRQYAIIYTTVNYTHESERSITMSERNKKLELLGSAPIPKALMALGVPIMIGMLINALYNLVVPILWADWAEVKWELFPSFFRWGKS